MTPNDKLPEEITKEIETQSEHHASVQWGDKAKFTNSFQYTNWANSADDYEDGATAWAPWKVKYDELHATIDDKIDKALHAERNAIQAKMTEMETGYLKQIQSMIDTFQMIVNAPVPANEREYISWFVTAKNIAGGVISDWEAEKYVQQFKDGKGKEAGNDA